MSLLRKTTTVWRMAVYCWFACGCTAVAGCIRGSYSPGSSSEPSHSWTLFSTRAGYRWLDELCGREGRRDTHCRGAPGADFTAFAGVEFEAALPQTTRDPMSISSITAGLIAIVQAVQASFKRPRVSVMCPDVARQRSFCIPHEHVFFRSS